MKLHDWLQQHGRTATWLAEQTGLSVSYAYRLASSGGPQRSPSIETCAKIARATGNKVTVGDFYDLMPAEPEERKRARLRAA